LDESDFLFLENIIGNKLPADLRKLYLTGNGGDVIDDRCIFILDDDMEYGIDHFLPIKYKRFDGDLLLDEMYNLFCIEKELAPHGFLPIAIDGGGFPFCYDIKTGKIYFCNVEHFSKDGSHIELICESLDCFLKNIVSEDDAYG
jgi:hypothetical protein